LRQRLGCGIGANGTAAEHEEATAAAARCAGNEKTYLDGCVKLGERAVLAQAICRPVMPQVNVVNASAMICADASERR
jgi:hypothetical protein